jgi:hypothetical protein
VSENLDDFTRDQLIAKITWLESERLLGQEHQTKVVALKEELTAARIRIQDSVTAWGNAKFDNLTFKMLLHASLRQCSDLQTANNVYLERARRAESAVKRHHWSDKLAAFAALVGIEYGIFLAVIFWREVLLPLVFVNSL